MTRTIDSFRGVQRSFRAHAYLQGKSATWLGTLSGVLLALAALLTNFIMHQKIISGDEYIALFTYMVIGAWLLVLFAVISYFMDNSRHTRRMTNETWGLAFISGVATSVGLVFSLRGNQVADANVNLQLESLGMVYIALWQVFIQRRIKLAVVGLPLFLAMVGGYFAVIGENWLPNWEAVFWVLLLYGVFNAVWYLTMGEGSGKAGASKFLLWRYIFFALGATLFSVVYAIGWTKWNMLTDSFRGALAFEVLVWVIPAMLLGYVYIYFWNLAAEPSRHSSTTQATLWKQSVQLICIVPLTWFVDKLSRDEWGWLGSILPPDPFGELPPDWAWGVGS